MDALAGGGDRRDGEHARWMTHLTRSPTMVRRRVGCSAERVRAVLNQTDPLARTSLPPMDLRRGASIIRSNPKTSPALTQQPSLRKRDRRITDGCQPPEELAICSLGKHVTRPEDRSERIETNPNRTVLHPVQEHVSKALRTSRGRLSSWPCQRSLQTAPQRANMRLSWRAIRTESPRIPHDNDAQSEASTKRCT